jgi:hypothetical protein
LTQTFPPDFAAAISGLEAVPPAGALEADLVAAPEAEELAAGAGAAAELVAGAEVAAGAGVALGATIDFWVLAFAAGAVGVLATGAAAVGWVASALADFLLLLLFLAAVVSEVPVALAGAAAGVVESALADFLLLFFAVALSDEPAAVAEVELWSASVVEDFFLPDFDLLVLDELSALLVSELVAGPDVVLFLDFVLDDFVSLAAAP